MAAYDDDIQLTVNLEPGKVVETAKKINDYIEKIFEKAKGKDTSTQFKSMQVQMDKVLLKSEQIQKSLEFYQEKNFPSPTYTKLLKQLQQVEEEYRKVKERKEEMDKAGKSSIGNLTYQDIDKRYSELSTLLADLQKQEQTMVMEGTNLSTGENLSEYKKLIEQLNQVNNQLVIYKQKALEAGEVDFSNMQESINGTGQTVEQELLGPIESVKFVLGTLVEAFRRNKDAAQDTGSSMEGMMQGTDEEIEDTQSRLSTFIQNFRDWAQESNGLQFFTGVASGAMNAISSINSIHTRLIQLSAQVSQLLGGALSRGLQGIGSLASTAFSGLASAAKRALTHVNNLRRSLMSFIGSKISDGLNKIKDSLSDIGKSAKKSNGGLNVGFKTFLRYGLGIRSVYVLVNKLRSALVDGFKNLAQSNAEFNQAMSTITSSLNWVKNSFAAAFAPIVETVAPIIANLAEKLVSVIRLGGQFIASITGKNVLEAQYVYTDYAESLDKSSKSTKKLNDKTKELKKTLAGFDDVEILKDNKDDDDEEEQLDYSFEPGKINSQVADLANGIKQKLLGILEVIKAAWRQEGQKLINSIKSALNSVKKLLKSIGDTFYKVFTDGYGFDWLVSIFQLLQNLFELIGAIADAFDKAWNDNNRGYDYVASIFEMFTSINNLLRDVGQTFIDVWRSDTGYRVASGILEVFTNIHLMVAALADALRYAWNENNIGYNLVDAIYSLFASILEIISMVAKDFATAFQSPVGKNMLMTLLILITTIIKALDTVAESFKKAWKDNGAGYRYILTIFNLFGEINGLLTDVAQSFINAWNDNGHGGRVITAIQTLFTNINITLQKITKAFRDAWNDGGQGEILIGKILTVFENIANTLDSITVHFGVAFSNNSGKVMVKSIFRVFEDIVDILVTVTDSFKNAWDKTGYNLIQSIFNLITQINGLLDTTAQAFKKAWENDGRGELLISHINEMFTSINNSLAIIPSSFAEAFSSNKGEEAINGILMLLDDAVFSLQDVSDYFAKAWNDNDVGKEYVESIFTTIKQIEDTLHTVNTSFRDAWKDEDNGAVLIAIILKTFKDINTAIGDASEAFKIAWEDGGHGEQLVTNISNAFGGIVTIIGTVSRDFGTMLKSESGTTAIGNILEAINGLIEPIGQVATDFENAWNDDNNGLNYIQSIFDKIGEISGALGDIFNSFVSAWAVGGEGKEIIQDVINTATNLNTIIIGYVESFRSAWNEGNKGVKTWDNILTPIQTIAGHIEDITNALADWAAGIDFSPLMESFNNVLEPINSVSDLVGGALKTAYEEVLIPLGSWSIEEGLPTLLDALASAIDLVTSAFNALKPVFEPIWNGIIKPLAETLGSALVTVIQNITSVFNNLATWINDNKEAYEEFGRIVGTAIDTITGAFGSVPDVIDGAVQKFEDFKNTVEQKVIDIKDAAVQKFENMKTDTVQKFEDIKTSAEEKFGNIKTAAEGKFEEAKTAILSRWGDIKDNLASMEQTVEDIKSYWGDAYNSAQTLFGDIKDTIKQKWDATKTNVSTTAYNMVVDVVKRFNNMKKRAKTKFEEIKDDASKKWGDIKSSIATKTFEIAYNTAKKWKEIKNGAANIFGKIKDDAATKWENIKTTIAGKTFEMVLNTAKKIEEIKTQFTELPGKISNAIGNVASIGKGVIDGILTGLRENVGDIANWFNGLGARIKEWIEDKAKAVLNMPGDIIQGAVNGAVDVATSIKEFITTGLFAKGGFPTKGQLFFARESGPEMVGKMGNSNVVANNQQIVAGIKAGVIEALTSVMNRMSQTDNTLDLSGNSLTQLQRVNDNLALLTQASVPLIAQGKLLPATLVLTDQMTRNLEDIRDTLDYQSADTISKDELRTMLIDIARNYISTSFYMGDEQVARHANNGNLRLSRMYGTT